MLHRHIDVNAEQVVGRVSSLLICGAVAAGTVFGCLVTLLLFLNHTFDTSHAKLEKGIKLVALSALVFRATRVAFSGERRHVTENHTIPYQ